MSVVSSRKMLTDRSSKNYLSQQSNLKVTKRSRLSFTSAASIRSVVSKETGRRTPAPTSPPSPVLLEKVKTFRFTNKQYPIEVGRLSKMLTSRVKVN